MSNNGYELGTAKSIGDTIKQTYPSQGVLGADEFHPEFKGSNVFGLTRVPMSDGPHLIGTVSKYAKIVDFSTGEVVYDFSDFGGTPRSGGDSYSAACEWQGKYYFGGWVIAPHERTDALDVENKYSYVVELDPEQGFGDGSADDPDSGWSVILSDKGGDNGLTGDGGGWAAEVQRLISTPTGVYICRSDDGGSGVNVGLYKYDGDQITEVIGSKVADATLIQHTLYARVSGSEFHKVDITDDTVITVDYLNSDYRHKTEIVADPAYRTSHFSNWVTTMNNILVQPKKNGIHFCWDDDNSESFFVTCLVQTVYDGGGTGYTSRHAPDRTNVKHVDGGVVIPYNHTSKSQEANISNPITMGDGYLLYLSQSGLRVINRGKWFGSLEVYNDRLYYGVSSSGHGNSDTFSQVIEDDVSVGYLPLSDIRSPEHQPPIRERLYYNRYKDGIKGGDGGEDGMIGGFPTLGYDKMKVSLETDTEGDFDFYQWGVLEQATHLRTESFSAEERRTIDLSDDMAGGIIGWEFDGSDAFLEGSINVQ